MRYSDVCTVRSGRSPRRSRRAPTTSPSLKITAAGPSFFSSYSEKYSSIARTSSVRVRSFSHAGGMSDTTASTISSPSSNTRLCRVWSRRLESDCPGGRTMLRVRARASASSDSRFFRSVLSSPLCAIRRNGCAIVGCGSVFVEKRVWKYSVRTECRGSRRSVKYPMTSPEFRRPLRTCVRALSDSGDRAACSRCCCGGLTVGDGLDREQGPVRGGVDLGAGPVLGRAEDPLHDRELVLLGLGARDGVVDRDVADQQELEALAGRSRP